MHRGSLIATNPETYLNQNQKPAFKHKRVLLLWTAIPFFMQKTFKLILPIT